MYYMHAICFSLSIIGSFCVQSVSHFPHATQRAAVLLSILHCTFRRSLTAPLSPPVKTNSLYASINLGIAMSTGHSSQ